MGGIGSGRRLRLFSKATVEGCWYLNVLALYRRGMLSPGHAFGWGWKTASIRIEVLHSTALKLSYTVTPRDGDLKEMQYIVPLEWRPCNYGGERPYFFCPLCAQRVTKLYLSGGRHFACRKCNNLAYACQHEAPAFRLLSRAQKIRAKLDSNNLSICDPLPNKPRYMHWRTYYRLCLQYLDTADLSLMQTAQMFGIQKT